MTTMRNGSLVAEPVSATEHDLVADMFVVLVMLLVIVDKQVRWLAD